VRRLSRVHIPGASGAGPLTPFVPCTLSLFRPIVHPDICQVGPAGDRPLYAIYAGGNVTAHVPGRVNRLSRGEGSVRCGHRQGSRSGGGWDPGMREMNIPRNTDSARPHQKRPATIAGDLQRVCASPGEHGVCRERPGGGAM
jgi:hypothetical protein